MTVINDNPWIKDEIGPSGRAWEEFYRNRWQHDKVVRSTHGVNCTGSCPWQIYVKTGIVTWEMQGLDYPSLEAGLPPYEPRGCQRGISFSWYLYSPLRVKYPYMRGAMLDIWRQARAEHDDAVAAWASIVEDPEKRAVWSSVVGIISFVNLPIVWFSVKWWRSLHQVQSTPKTVDPDMTLALRVNAWASLILLTLFLLHRYRIALATREAEVALPEALPTDVPGSRDNRASSEVA